MQHGNIADPEGWFGCSFLQLTGLRAPNPYQFEELRLFVVSRRSCRPRRLPAGLSPALPRSSLFFDSLKLAYRHCSVWSLHSP